MYQAELFYNTGFNAVNIPDSENTLRTAAGSTRTFPALDILQPTALTTVRLKATYAQAVGADYLLLRNQEDAGLFCFYSIVGAPRMSSADVANFDVVEDPILTAGGISNLQFLDGITSRHHIAVADDTFGSYIEDDPYLTLTETPDYHSMELFDKGTESDFGFGEKVMVVIASADMEALDTLHMQHLSVQNQLQGSGSGTDFSFTLQGGDSFKYKPDSADTTTFADVKPDFSTMIAAGSAEGTVNEIVGQDGPVGAEGYAVNSEYGIGAYGQSGLINIQRDIENAVGLGLESVIVDAVMIPKSFCQFNASFNLPYSDGWYSRNHPHIGCIQAVGNFYLPASNSDFAYEYDDQIVNKRALYGKYNGYSLISKATGSSTEILPEDMAYHNGQSTLGLAYGKAPVPMCLPDIRANGRPYFNFAYIKTSGNSFMAGAISGSQWRKATLITNVKSGAYLTEMDFRRNQNEKDFWASDVGLYMGQGGDAGYTGQLDKLKSDINNSYVGTTDAIMGVVGSTAKGGVEAGASSAGTGAVGMLGSYYRNAAQQKATNAYNEAIWRAHLNSKADGDSNYYRAMAGDPLALAQYEREREKNVEIASFLQNVTIFDPGFKINTEASLRDINGNGVYFIRRTPSAKDRARHDKILSQFGYKITEPITAGMLTNRNKFNYIQAGGVSVNFITSTYYGKYLKERVSEVFANGVRIWHVKPDVAHYVPGANT